MDLDQNTLIRARSAMREAVQGWIYDPNVMLVDFGWHERGGKLFEDELAIRVHVIEKYERGPALQAAIAWGKTRNPIPDEIGGFPVDRPQGVYKLHPFPGGWWLPPRGPRAQKIDPMKGGISISNVYQNAYATLGGLVADRTTGARMILSNWHVLVGDWWAQPGRPTCQPGVYDGGSQADTVATLSRHAMGSNFDAAVAELTGERQLLNNQFGLGPVKGVSWAQLGMAVCKSGRRTGITYGLVTAIEGTLKMNYRGLDRLIQNVITIEPRVSGGQVSAAGDSGSLWVEESTMLAVGLHFAGTEEPGRALAMDMQPILNALNVNMVI